ncbi:MAG: hypothetical protein ACI9R3_004515 [Verrucomicrobiales bacterium]|jgi:hypothetical protein
MVWIHSDLAGDCPELTDKHGADISDAFAANAIDSTELEQIAKTAPEWSPQDSDDETAQLIETGRSLSVLAGMKVDHSKTLLGNRWLCRGARAGLIVASTGVGKSVVANQAAIFWSLGKEAFDIDSDESAQIAERTLSISLRGTTDNSFLQMLKSLAERWKPDLLIVDPLGVYIGGDVKDAALIAEFLDGPFGLNVIAQDLDIGILVICHTPKTNFRDTSNWNSSDWTYASAGSAGLNNSTVCSLVIDQADMSGKIFRFIAAKRGNRIGWPERARFYCHGEDGIYWREASPPDLASPDGEDQLADQMAHVLERMDEANPMKKANLITYARSGSEHFRKGLAKEPARGAVDLCIAEGKLFEWTEHREKLVSLKPRELTEEAEE